MSNSEKKKGLPVIKYRGECPMHHPLDEGYGPLVCKQCADEEIAKLKAALAEETKIVDRIWDMFGRPSYKELAGRSIYDLISGLQKEFAEERALLDSAADIRLVGWAASISDGPLRNSISFAELIANADGIAGVPVVGGEAVAREATPLPAARARNKSRK